MSLINGAIKPLFFSETSSNFALEFYHKTSAGLTFKNHYYEKVNRNCKCFFSHGILFVS